MSVASESGSQQIYTEEAPRRHAPVTETGVLGWVRHNLFRTPFDTILTLVSAFVIYQVIASAIAWAVADANWFAITRNLSLFMLGPLQADQQAVTNVQIITLILAFSVGLSLAAWSHVGHRSWIAIAIAAIISLILPPVIASAFALPPSILAAGSMPVVSGTVTETPLNEIAFVAAGGETFSVRLADEATTDDSALAQIAAFTDRATDAAMNVSRSRVESLARLEFVTARLADPNITNSERAQLLPELETLTTATETAVTERYDVNAAPVTVRLLTGDLETVVLEGTVAPGGEPLTTTLPATGWYVLEKTVAGEGVSLLELHGVYPLLERQFPRPLRNAEGRILVSANGQPRTQTITQYARIIDDLTLEQVAPPRRDGTEVRRFLVIDNQYRGKRPFSEFLVLHVGPFLERVNRALIPCLLLVFAGYMAGPLVNRYLGPIAERVTAVRRSEPLPEGIERPTTRRISGRAFRLLLGTMLLAALTAYFVTRSPLPGNASLSDKFGLVLTSVFFASLICLFVWMLIRMLAPADGVPYLSRVVSALWFVMPIIIFFLVVDTDVGRWGGLFLTFMLTVVGIVASFPIGVLLALGRRADNLPVVKYLCIAFIETVRGVPLITVLFLASLALPLVNPAFSTVPGAVRAMVAITLFSAAYLAENVRGGLQSVPPGQTEAARALGMNPVQVTMFITLPQALRAVIPALVGQCISLFKDTSLVAIVGLLDLTKSADSVVAQAEYIGLRREAYIFISIVYFVFSYFMGYVSRKLEQSGSGRARQTKL